MILLVKHTLSELLDLAVEDIEDGDKLVELGIDSLNGIELLTQFENELGASISPTSLVQAPSIRVISERLLTILGLEYDVPVENTTLTLDITALPGIDPDLTLALEQADRLPEFPGIPKWSGTNRVVFLTGVTGLLGSHLFRDLITQTSFHVYLLVRPEKGNTDMLSRLKTAVEVFDLDLDRPSLANRFTLFSGDLAEPDLGLAREAYRQIQETADLVLHSAAQVHHLKPYHLLKQTNVDATLEILKLCTTSRHVIPLHYVSAIGIFIADLNTSASFTEADLPESLSELKNGYFKSKWISERILQQMH